MARFKPARGRKPAAQRPNAVGCIILLVLVFAVVYLVLFYSVKFG